MVKKIEFEKQIQLVQGTANDLKLDRKKAPGVDEHMAKTVQGLLREKLADEALTATQSHYNTPENFECLTSTKVNHLIWDTLKSHTRSADIKLQRVQSNLVKGLVPTVSVIEKLVKARDNIPKDALDVPELSVPFKKFLFGNDADSSKQMKDLAKETKVSKKLNPRARCHESNGYRGYKHTKAKGFGSKCSSRGLGTQAIKNLNWKRPAPNKTEEGRGEGANK